MSCKSRKYYTNAISQHGDTVLTHLIHEGSIYAATPRTQRGLPVVLGGDPKGKNFLYANGTSVIIRDIAVRTFVACIITVVDRCNQ